MDTQSDFFSQIIEALRFAAEKHKDQRRKDAEASPYIKHPIKVMQILWNEGLVRDPEVLVAAVLHDTLEDTETNPEELKSLFGDAVCKLVQEATDDKSLPKQTRKQLQIDKASQKSAQAKQLKIADKVANIRDIVRNPPKNWSLRRKQEYIVWAEAVFNGLCGVNEKLDQCFLSCIAEARQKMDSGKGDG